MVKSVPVFSSSRVRTFCTALAILASGVSLGACGGQKKADAAVEACEELLDTLVNRTMECSDELGLSLTRQRVERQTRDALDCEDALDIRDENELYDECLPEMEILDCGDLIDGLAPESCEDQILF